VSISWLRVLAALAVIATPVAGSAALLPVSSGLVLNFQADNVDGVNNATLSDGEEVTEWVDVAQAGGNATQNNATVQGAIDYLVVGQGTPNFVTGPRPGVQFTRVPGTPARGDALGFNGSVNGLTTNNAFTTFVVGDFTSPGPARSLQIGRQAAENNRVVAFGNTGYRFNGGSKVFAEDQFAVGINVATYAMDMTQLYSAASYRLDGADGTNSVTAGTSLNLTSFNQGLVIGAGKSNQSPANPADKTIDPLNGIVYAIVVYNRILTTSEILEVEAFLNQQYVIPEPATSALACMAMVAIGVLRRSIGDVVDGRQRRRRFTS
jgi:hypothetical protein